MTGSDPLSEALFSLRVAHATERALAARAFANATSLWAATEDIIEVYSENVNFYNLLLHSAPDQAHLASGECTRDERLAWSEVVLGSVERNLALLSETRVSSQSLELPSAKGPFRESAEGYGTVRKLLAADGSLEGGDSSDSPLYLQALEKLRRKHVDRFYGDPLDGLMNGPVREKLGIIPDHVRSGFHLPRARISDDYVF
jgi:hypothetical protein